MAIENVKEMLIKASREKYAIGAFNITNIIQMIAIEEAACELRSPVIIQTSVSPTEFYTAEFLVSIFKHIAQKSPIPIALHLDHCEDVSFCKSCALAGYTSIMIDASRLEFHENINDTKKVVDYCHSLDNVSVEGELGVVLGVEDQIVVSENEAKLCDPADVYEFVEKTGVDLLAPAIGTAHGIYKTKNPKIDFFQFEKINKILNGKEITTPLVIHGGTGLPKSVVQRLIYLGGAKINVSTELKHAYIDTTYEHISGNPNEYNPGKINKKVKKAIKDIVYKWIDIIGSEDKI